MKTTGQERRETAEMQRLQVGAALVVAVVVLVAILLRALHGNVLPPGWWRP